MPSSPFAEFPETTTSKTAVASMAMGILSLFCSILTAIPAVITGIVALRKINNSRGLITGSGMAITGIVTGSIGLLMVPVLLALLLPAVQAARDAAQRNMSMNNMKEISLAVNSYEMENKTFPPAGVADGEEGSQLSWRVHILPFMYQDELYQRFHLDEPWDSEHNRQLIAEMPEVYRSPGHELSEGKTSYLFVTGPGAAFQGEPAGPKFEDFAADGVSNTIIMVEADASEAVEWTRPDDWEYDPANVAKGLGGLRKRGFLAATADVGVRFIDNDVPPQTLNAMITREGGERVIAP